MSNKTYEYYVHSLTEQPDIEGTITEIELSELEPRAQAVR
jgi:hypothetical protein